MPATKGTKKARSRRPLTRQQRLLRKRRVVELLGDLGCVAITCRAAGITTPTYYRWKGNDYQFADQCDEAINLATDKLEIEARRRAVEGYDEVTETVTKDGATVTKTVRKYSDSLLSKLLTGNRPEKYGRPGTRVSVNNNTLNINADGVTEVGPERQAMLNRLRTIIVGAYPEADRRE